MMKQEQLVEYGKTQYKRAGFAFSKVGEALARWWAIILVVAILAGVAGFFSSMMLLTPRYEASVNLIVNEQTAENAVSDKKIGSATVETYAVIIKSDIVLDKVAENLDLGMNYQELADMVTVSAIDNTQIMRVTVQSENPSTSLSIVKEIATVAPAVVVDALEASSCKVVSKARANSTQVFPNNTAAALVSAVLGMILACTVVIVRVLTNDTITSDQDVQVELGIPVLAVIHEVEGAR